MARKGTNQNNTGEVSMDDFGPALAGRSHKWADGVAVVVTVGDVVRVEGGRYNKVRCRINGTTADGAGLALYLPESWAEKVNPYRGARVYFRRDGSGLSARYDVRPEKGAKPAANPAPIQTVTMDEHDDDETPRKGRNTAKSKARRALA